MARHAEARNGRGRLAPIRCGRGSVNTAYASIHTTKFPAGEIRGQVRRGDREDN
jgi:hypothetical protein